MVFVHAREKRQTGQRIEEGLLRWDDELLAFAVGIGRLDLPRRDDAVGGPHGVKTLRLSGLRSLGERIGSGGAAGDRQEDA